MSGVAVDVMETMGVVEKTAGAFELAAIPATLL